VTLGGKNHLPSSKKFWIRRFEHTQNTSVFFATNQRSCRVETKAWNRIRKCRKITALCSVNSSTVQTHRPHCTWYTRTQNIVTPTRKAAICSANTKGSSKNFPASTATDSGIRAASNTTNGFSWGSFSALLLVFTTQFSLQNLQQRFGTHGAIPPLDHTSLIFHRFLSHMPHTDSRGALSAILFQIRWVLGSLPLPYSTFSGFFSLSLNYVDMTLKEAMINATY
jgi:hypothetical protein